MQNAAGDSLEYIASGLADDIARRLEGVGGFAVRSGAHSDWPAATRRDYQAVGRQFGARVILKTELKRIGDSLEVRATVANRVTLSERQIAPRRFVMAGLSSVAGKLAAAIAGAAFRAPNPSTPHDAVHQVDAESYRLTLEGWHELLSRSNSPAARALFLRATERDQLNSRAWAGLSSTWGTQAVTDQVPFDEGYLNTVAAATKALQLDSLDGSALANLAIVEALNDRKASSGLGLLQRAKKVDPSNPEVYLVEQALYLFAWQLDKALADIRIAKELDPLTPRYPQREAGVELCADHPAAALQIYEGLLRSTPADTIAQAGKVRSLARLGRYDDALASWRFNLGSVQTPLAQVVREARGADGYWTAKHAEGAARLAGMLDRAARGARVSTSSLAQAKFAAGDFEGGFAALEQLLRDQHRAVWRLRCNPAYDEVLTFPRFKQVVVAAGALPLR
jgi:tetratricopeptide (TPR) repeat protein